MPRAVQSWRRASVRWRCWRKGPALHPVWTLLHAGGLGLGVNLAWQARQPAWMAALGARPAPAAARWHGTAVAALPAGGARASYRGAGLAASAGAAWVAWPCGLLQSALLVAAMTGSAGAGAASMAGFAATSAFGLTVGPWGWRRWQQRAARTAHAGACAAEAVRGGASVAPGAVASSAGALRVRDRTGAASAERAAVPAAGVLLALASAWALGQDLWIRVVAFCLAGA